MLHLKSLKNFGQPEVRRPSTIGFTITISRKYQLLEKIFLMLRRLYEKCQLNNIGPKKKIRRD
jgi:hypothetical protein